MLGATCSVECSINCSACMMVLLLLVAFPLGQVHSRPVFGAEENAAGMADGLLSVSRHLESARRGLLACQKQTAVPRAKLSISPLEFAFDLLEQGTPESCGKFDLIGFRECAKEIGVTTGCCTANCTQILTDMQGPCWNDVQRAVCGLKSSQSAVMLDLLMRRCDTERRPVWCTQGCEEQVVKPRAKLTISGFRFGFEVRTFAKPAACSAFEWEDLEACTEDLGVETGCCKKECSAILEKITTGCMNALTKSLCKAPSNQVALIMDLLSRRCDPLKREIACPKVLEAFDSCHVHGEAHYIFSNKSALLNCLVICVKCCCVLREASKGLLKAATNGNVTEVERLLSRGAKIETRDESGGTALDTACFHGHQALVQVLIDAGANVKTAKTGGWTPMDSAALNGHAEVIQTLVNAGADPNAAADNGATPLHSAAYSGKSEAVQTLVMAGADVDVTADKGWTPLHNAAYFGHKEVIKVLIDAGADSNAINYWGWTPLHWAAYQGHPEATQALISAGANIRAETKKSTTQEGVFYPSARTALHVAAASGHSDVVEVLLKNGANKKKRDSAGNTAHDVVGSDLNGRDLLLDLLE